MTSLTKTSDLVPHSVADLLAALIEVPLDYRVLICDDSNYPGTNWTDKLRIEVDPEQAVVRIWSICT